ncbi:4-diphosphocytidyl-2-C-methyl-D-erythritol kinase [Plasmodium gonderi]|uniref:4-diphosphocytidyl-2-C-methyl-D-erythritol kinase n=1 Tax=Plasmodium gonderi TaxID=77519 RepID=A0A1Y1JNA9_PLAGO|nr:4-diphosphocytidyl-2-C-methyl-D-erythritol kinase [Plasmodium gonderi]GAW81534.1 4-diphosphocytidyl-2-C-methyl-D-erythritol kinase [Plasmodium gonderi]
MKICLKIKRVLLLCFFLAFTNVVSKNASNNYSKFGRDKYDRLKGVTLHFSHVLPHNNGVKNKHILRKDWMFISLSNHEKCRTKTKKRKYTSFDGITSEHNAGTFQRGNILCNKKMKLIIQLLNRTKWYDFKFFSPAKINLFLRLKERKETHNEISTLMHSINLGDDIFITSLSREDQRKLEKLLFPCQSGDFLTIKKTKEHDVLHENKIKCLWDKEKDEHYFYNNYPLNDDNIIAKILKRYREELNINDDIKFLVHINKRSPIFSGIGGGSSNGASVFYFLENYFYKFLKTDQLRNEFLKKIGSDISFFSSSGFAYCTDKGNYVIDLIDAQATISDRRIYIFQINEGLSSKLVYQNVNYNNIVQYNPVSLLKHFIINPVGCNIINHIEEKEFNYLKHFVSFDHTELKNMFINDLEHSAFLLLKKVKYLKDFLMNQNIFDAVAMSGSGSSLFALTKKNMSLHKEKRHMKNLIKDVQRKLHLNIKAYLCSFLRKPKHLWYKPSQVAEMMA